MYRLMNIVMVTQSKPLAEEFTVRLRKRLTKSGYSNVQYMVQLCSNQTGYFAVILNPLAMKHFNFVTDPKLENSFWYGLAE